MSGLIITSSVLVVGRESRVMITYKKVPSTRRELESITCDKCKRIFTDELYIQEFHMIRFQGGYASVFGDETNVSCDLCQDCLKEMIGEFCHYGDEE